jgi:hypothetical protein
MFQVLVSMMFMKRQLHELDWKALCPAVWKTILATALMSLACWSVLEFVSWQPIWKLPASLAAAVTVYLLASYLVRLHEPFELLKIRRRGNH